MLTFLLFGITLVSYFLWSYFKNAKLLEFCKLQGGPTPYPILGNINVLFKQNILEGLSQLKQIYTLPCNFWVWNDYYYVTDCPYEVKTLLSNTNKSFQKASFYDDLIKVILNNSLVTASASEVEKWKFERKILGKAFAPSMWNRYTPVFHKKALRLLNSLKEIDNFDSLLSVLTRNSFEIFMESFMGVEIKSELDENELLTALTQTIEILSHRSTINRFLPHWYYKSFTEEGRKFYRAINCINGRLKQLIDEKRNELFRRTEFTENLNKSILIESLLLREDTQMLTNDIFRQMILIYFTSIDTNVLTLAYMLLQLGMNPEIQENVYREVRQIVGDEAEITIQDLSNLKYLEQCIFETLRTFAVVPIVGRHITENIHIGKKILPKGANVLISPYLMHRNEKYWPNPDIFDPSRFSAENAHTILPGSYIPFLIGPRDCLGRYYSMAQVKIMAANILRKYRVQVNPQVANKIQFKFYIVIKPKVNFSIGFKRRNEEEK